MGWHRTCNAASKDGECSIHSPGTNLLSYGYLREPTEAQLRPDEVRAQWGKGPVHRGRLKLSLTPGSKLIHPKRE